MNDVSKFIEHLSWRMRGENDLSDLTWAFCQASEKFRDLFLSFIFGNDEFNYQGISDFQREYSRGDSRPDLYFRNSEEEYIIEVKINDRNQHFDQYNKTFPNAKKGYIANYVMPEQDGYEIRTWENFSKYLKQQDINDNEIALELLKGYLNYLDNVCAIRKIEKMNLTGIKSLYYFKNAIDKIIEKDDEDFYVTRYPQTDKNNDIRQGRCFQLKLKNTNIEDTWGWIGLYFYDKTVVCIEFDKYERWGLPIYEILKANTETLSEGKYFCKPYIENGAYYFEMKEEILIEFEQKNESDAQIELLEKFFNEVIDYLKKKAGH